LQSPIQQNGQKKSSSMRGTMGKAVSRVEFLNHLYSFCEGKIELRALPSKHRTFCGIQDHKAIDTFCKKHARENVYFGVATRAGGGTKEHILNIPAIWIDIDFKDCPKEAAHKKLKAFPLRPSLVIESGGGYHVYWLLKEAYTKEDIEAIEAVNRQLATALYGDLNACDASRILRMPDSTNFKYGPPRPVKCILSRDVRYDLSDFEFLPDAAQECDPQGSTPIECTYPLYKGVTNSQ
jgi:putative DNA primase/helicase